MVSHIFSVLKHKREKKDNVLKMRNCPLRQVILCRGDKSDRGFLNNSTSRIPLPSNSVTFYGTS